MDGGDEGPVALAAAAHAGILHRGIFRGGSQANTSATNDNHTDARHGGGATAGPSACRSRKRNPSRNTRSPIGLRPRGSAILWPPKSRGRSFPFSWVRRNQRPFGLCGRNRNLIPRWTHGGRRATCLVVRCGSPNKTPLRPRFHCRGLRTSIDRRSQRQPTQPRRPSPGPRMDRRAWAEKAGSWTRNLAPIVPHQWPRIRP